MPKTNVLIDLGDLLWQETIRILFLNFLVSVVGLGTVIQRTQINQATIKVSISLPH